MELKLISFFGCLTMIAAAWAISYNRKLFPWRTVVWGLGLQFVLAILILKTPWGADFFVLNFSTTFHHRFDSHSGLCRLYKFS